MIDGDVDSRSGKHVETRISSITLLHSISPNTNRYSIAVDMLFHQNNSYPDIIGCSCSITSY